MSPPDGLLGRQQVQRPLIRRAIEEPVEQPVKHRSLRRHRCKQCRARPEFQVVRGSEDLSRGASLHQQRLRTRDESRTQQGMCEIRTRFSKRRDRIVLRRWTGSEPCQLWKDEPHPVRALPSAPDLRKRLVIDALLCVDEPGEIVRISRHLSILLPRAQRRERKPEAGSRKPGSRKPEAGSRKPEAGKPGSRKPEAGSRTCYR
jgi:hypothetical protein